MMRDARPFLVSAAVQLQSAIQSVSQSQGVQDIPIEYLSYVLSVLLGR